MLWPPISKARTGGTLRRRGFAIVTLALPLLGGYSPQAIAQTYRWDGTAPNCNGSCGPNETEITRSATPPGGGAPPAYYGPPFGAACLTGTKALCESTPGTSCHWEGTAPACNGTCPAGFVPSLPPPGSDSGHSCWSGQKTYCCQVHTSTAQPPVTGGDQQTSVGHDSGSGIPGPCTDNTTTCGGYGAGGPTNPFPNPKKTHANE